ncbi:MAG: DUF2849 domain-containing protein [Alphaproteobacteria bacterium]
MAVTANRLADGAVVFRAGDGSWSAAIDAAAIAAAPAEALLAAAEADARAALVVGPYLIEVERRDGRIVPALFRERIRAAGPTIDLPKA